MERFRNSKIVRKVAPWIAVGTLAVCANTAIDNFPSHVGEYDEGCSMGILDPQTKWSYNYGPRQHRGIYLYSNTDAVFNNQVDVTVARNGTGAFVTYDAYERTRSGDDRQNTWYKSKEITTYSAGYGLDLSETNIGSFVSPLHGEGEIRSEDEKRYVCVSRENVYVAP